MSREYWQLPIEPIFESTDDMRSNVCLNLLNDGLELYAYGYKEAADSLTAEVIGTGRRQDYFVFPICFLYRQYIELRLKEVIRAGKRLLDESGDFPMHHKLLNLWDDAVVILKKVFGGDIEPPDFLSVAAHVVAEFSKLDPDSFAFRYPIDKKGETTLSDINSINIHRVHEYVNVFAAVMESASTAISEYMSSKTI